MALAAITGVLVLGTLLVLTALAIADAARATYARPSTGPSPEEQAQVLLVEALHAVRPQRADAAAQARLDLVRAARAALAEQERAGGREARS